MAASVSANNVSSTNVNSSSSSSSALLNHHNTTNNYVLDYSPPSSNTSTLKEKYLSQIKNINSNNYNSSNFVNSNHNNSNNNNNNNNNNDSNNNVSSTNNIANQINFLNINGFSQSGINSAQQAAGQENKCLRCSNQVYSLERIGPIKGNIYHKTCFKCLMCDRQLDLKTYYTNQVDLNDRQIYCQSHAPKSGKGVFGADNIYIHNVLNAPKLDVMQKCDNKPKANIDGSARHIMHAMHAQHLIQMGNRKDQFQHRFPVMPQINNQAREAIRKAQEILEAKQRAEEDMLLQVKYNILFCM